MYVNTVSPCFCFISDCAVPSCAEAPSCRNAHLGVGVRHIQDAPARWSAYRLAHCLGSPGGGLHVLQIYQQLSLTAHRRTAPRQVAYCDRTERNAIALSSAVLSLHCWLLANLCYFIFCKQGWTFNIGPITNEDTGDYRDLTKQIFTGRTAQQISFGWWN
jgi:hypothetical protein